MMCTEDGTNRTYAARQLARERADRPFSVLDEDNLLVCNAVSRLHGVAASILFNVFALIYTA